MFRQRTTDRFPPGRWQYLAAVLAVSCLLHQGCGSVPLGGAEKKNGKGLLPGVESQAQLIMMEDARLYEPLATKQIIDGGKDLQARLALSLGRIGDPQATGTLVELLGHRSEAVRYSAAFGLGLLANSETESALVVAVIDDDRQVATRAIEALARSSVPLERVRALLDELPATEADARLMPVLFRFTAEEIPTVAVPALKSDDPATRRWAVYALARRNPAAAVEELREFLDDPDPWIRGWTARALGAAGGGEDLELLLPLLAAPEATPVIQALRAGGRLVADGRVAAAETWRSELRRLLSDPRPGVRLTAIETSGYWLLDDELGDSLQRFFEAGNRRERELALMALAVGGDPRADAAVREASRSTDRAIRSQAVRVAARLGSEAIVEGLVDDDEPAVRLAVLEARITDENPDPKVLRAMLLDGDPVVRAAVLEVLSRHPVVSLEELVLAMNGPPSHRFPDLRIYGARALSARAAEPLERGGAIAQLEELAADPELLVRRAANAALAELGRETSAIGHVNTRRDLRAYRAIAAHAVDERRVELKLEAGSLMLRLTCDLAPLACFNFLQLANQGYYDGLEFHRVVPNFVVQVGDPRGDGWGGPGYTIRDEYSPMPYKRGVLGMARSGPDTAGSQFFITLSHQPHLDGNYTAFGEVVAGEDLLDGIVQGDKIVAVREVH